MWTLDDPVEKPPFIMFPIATCVEHCIEQPACTFNNINISENADYPHCLSHTCMLIQEAEQAYATCTVYVLQHVPERQV